MVSSTFYFALFMTLLRPIACAHDKFFPYFFDNINSKHPYTSITRPGPEFGRSELEGPEGVVADDQGNVYIADTWNHRIQKYDKEGGLVSSWGSRGSGDEELDQPEGMAIFNGILHIADRYNNRIQRTDLEGNFLEAIGSPTRSDFSEPTDISFDREGNMYVVEYISERIQKLDQDGTHVADFDKGCSASGQLRGSSCETSSVAVDSEGNVYAAYINHKVVKYSSTGDVLATINIAGNGTPKSIAVDSEDNIFVVDSANKKVLMYDALSEYIGCFGEFPYAAYISIGKDDHMYVADSITSHIEKFMMGPRKTGDFDTDQSVQAMAR
uniref:Peptidylamidoglycolate lyase n=1 Tax=Asterionellopsis glacialis TaxID=33640 RepID=A0A7S0KXU1_9STRA|mmetsp:Transcript_354/g.472  ORF Transcript_354/g.472 Transcript_354/m.472 type:complete len:326 (+) Transcript_354:37-1014(+)